jgi:Rod binding domain-containing protein
VTLPVDSNSVSLRPLDLGGVASPATGTQSKPVDSPDEQKLKKAAGDFESILLASMWRAMKHSFGENTEAESDPAHGMIEDWGIEVMAGAMGRAGGLGIGKLILKHLEPQLDKENLDKTGSSTKLSGNLADIHTNGRTL